MFRRVTTLAIMMTAVSTAYASSSSVRSSSSSSQHSSKTIRNINNHKNKNALLLDRLPETGESWSTLSNGVEVLPAARLSPLAQEHWRRLTSSDDNGNSSSSSSFDSAYHTIFVDGTETYYDEYAQAWRFLGFYIDCDYQEQQDAAAAASGGCTRFLLWAAYIDESYQGNGINEYMYYDRKNDRWDASTCLEGSTTSDSDSNSTSDSDSSENATTTTTTTTTYERCVKMDCHLDDTHFSLLGFFKEPNYDQWMEQLFQNEGDCVWTDEEYRFMQGHVDIWPLECTETSFETEEGETVYYDLQPMPYGDMDIGLFLDSSCVVPYTGDLTAEEVLRTMTCSGQEGGDDETLQWMCNNNYTDYQYGRAAYLTNENATDAGNSTTTTTTTTNQWKLNDSVNRWNEAFDVYKQCQPCKTHDLTSFVAGYSYVANQDGTRYGAWMDNLQQGMEEGDDANNAFRCRQDDNEDAASSNSVNQCMKFRTNTDMMTATWQDVEMAAIQGTTTTMQIPNSSKGQFSFGQHKYYGINNGSHHYGKSFTARNMDQNKYMASILIVLISSIMFGCSLYRWIVAKDEYAEWEEQHQSHPLMANDKAVTA